MGSFEQESRVTLNSHLRSSATPPVPMIAAALSFPEQQSEIGMIHSRLVSAYGFKDRRR